MVRCEAQYPVPCAEFATHVVHVGDESHYACVSHAEEAAFDGGLATATRLSTICVALIEYGDTAAPAFIVAESEHLAMAGAIAEVLRSQAAGLTDEFLSGHPRPNYSDERAVAAWLEALESEHFVPMVTVEAVPILPILPRP